jgi:hypothetical protein
MHFNFKNMKNKLLIDYSTTKTGRHDIAEILLKVALSKKKSINNLFFIFLKLKCIEG